MGEAKRRKQMERNFGRIPKSSHNRGLVVCPPIEIQGSNLFVKSSTLDPQELRFALLFWDNLLWPSSRAVHFASGPDEAFLQAEGILSRPEYTVYGDAAQGIARGQIQAFHNMEQAEPGAWALSQGENSFLLKEGIIEEGRGTLVELHRAVPIPKHDVPLNEILEFKLKRKDELLILRHLLESFTSAIDTASDKQTALQKRKDEIDSACADLLTVRREWRLPVYLSNIRASFNLTPLKFIPASGAA